jgi:hypothetical protein
LIPTPDFSSSELAGTGLADFGLRSLHMDFFDSDRHETSHSRHVRRRLCLSGVRPPVAGTGRNCHMAHIRGFWAVLGFGYLAKAVMFPLAFVFLAAAMFSFGSYLESRAADIDLNADLRLDRQPINRLAFSRGTCPLWYDTSYWHEGIKPSFVPSPHHFPAPNDKVREHAWRSCPNRIFSLEPTTIWNVRGTNHGNPLG